MTADPDLVPPSVDARTVVVLAKRPVPGRVKTRLAPDVGHSGAATLAAAALEDTLDVVSRAPVGARLLAFDGDPAGWLRPGWRHVRQPPGGLDDRIVAAFRAVPAGPAVLVGMDTPQITAAHLQAFDPSRYDAALGPARDGGFWLLALADPRRGGGVVRGVEMSTPHTGRDQLARLRAAGLRVQLLDVLDDVDTVAVAHAVAAAAPDTRFAAALDRVTRRLAG